METDEWDGPLAVGDEHSTPVQAIGLLHKAEQGRRQGRAEVEFGYSCSTKLRTILSIERLGHLTVCH